MRNWHILEEKEGEIFFLCEEKYHTKRKIYPDPESKSRVDFWILFNDQGKTIGYYLKYKYDKKYPKFSTYNSFGIVYNQRDNSKYNFEVIFEDSNVRFIAYDHVHQIKDYFLVGRWKPSEETNYAV